ncbi:MAG: type II secretion system protein GspG [Kiritimatiellales bacterium]
MKRSKRRLAKNSGFTLIEILLVVVIIGIIASIAIPNIAGKLDTALETKAAAGLKTVQNGINEYYMMNFKYPSSLDELTKSQDGKPAILTPSALNDPWGSKYQYSTPGSHNMGFDLSTKSPKGKEFNNWD